MKTRTKIVVGIVVLLGSWVASILIASAAGETVTLTTTDAAGTTHETPLWIVDYEGSMWLRAGSASAGWLERIGAHSRVDVERGGATQAYRAISVPDATDEINAQMALKYGFADRLVGILVPGSRGHSMAVRLDPEAS